MWEGRVILYADQVTESMYQAITETNRRREIQSAFNQKNIILFPKLFKKKLEQ